MNSTTYPRLVLLASVLLYTALAGARSRADRPTVDEAWFGSPAMNLARHGSMHTSILEHRGTSWEGIDRYTYWILPAYPVVLAGWLALTGAGLFTMRLLSVLFGCVVIMAMYVLVKRLMRDRGTAALAAVLLALDFTLVRAGAVARMDGMCAAFGFGGIAIHLVLRERNARAAFVAGHALVAVSVFTHPNGILYFLALMLTAIWLDRRSLRLSDLFIGALPYVLLLAVWGMYIANDPPLFRRQFGGNASGRLTGIGAPIVALQRELHLRYLAGGQTSLRLALLLPWIIGIASALGIPALRRHRAVQLLLALMTVFFVYQWLFEAVKLHFYAVHLTPLGMALFAIALRWMWLQSRWRFVPTAAAVLLMAVQLAGTAYTIRRDSLHRAYAPVVEYVRDEAGPQELVMGSAELAFGLGFDANLLDDPRLGYHSGKRPDLIVLDRRYKETVAIRLPVEDPPASKHVSALLPDYVRVFAVEDYEVLRRSSR